MATTQNTAAGTQDGQNIVPTNGNSLLDLFGSLSNVISNFGDDAIKLYSSFTDVQATANANNDQAATQPKQTAPANAISNPLDFFSNPENVKSTLTIGIVGIGLIVLLAIVIKKV